MTFDIPAFVIEWYELVIIVLYLVVGIMITFVKIVFDAQRASMGRAFGYPHQSFGFIGLVLLMTFWLPVVLIIGVFFIGVNMYCRIIEPLIVKSINVALDFRRRSKSKSKSKSKGEEQ